MQEEMALSLVLQLLERPYETGSVDFVQVMLLLVVTVAAAVALTSRLEDALSSKQSYYVPHGITLPSAVWGLLRCAMSEYP